MLESVKHVQSVFVTLTYASEHLPGLMSVLETKQIVNATLYPRDVQLWLKRLRKVAGKFRYYLVGEYGEKTDRPHYHAALFGVTQGLCLYCRHYRHPENCDCMIRQSWPYGHVHVGQLTKESAQYIGGYVTKKLTRRDDPLLYGRHPEFARMSLKPGIGADSMKDVGDVLTSWQGVEAIRNTGDVPMALNHGKKSMPLGRYLRQRLRKECGLDAEMLKQSNLRRWSAEMVQFFEEEISKRPGWSAGSLGQVLVDANAQKAVNQEAGFKLFTKKERKL